MTDGSQTLRGAAARQLNFIFWRHDLMLRAKKSDPEVLQEAEELLSAYTADPFASRFAGVPDLPIRIAELKTRIDAMRRPKS